jgi:uncharacterized protein YndB with AHSA1/START domain
MSVPDLVFTFDLPHAPAKVWRALTDPALLEKWLMATDMRAELGNKFTFKNTQWNVQVDCEILEIEANKKIRYAWRSKPLDTVVTWTLTPTAKGTRLELVHSGFPHEKGPWYEGAKNGWQQKVGELEKVLAS